MNHNKMFAESEIITIVAGKGQLAQASSILATPNLKCCSMHTSLCNIEKELKKAASSAVLISYTNSAKANELIEQLYFGNSAISGQEETYGTPVLITENRVPNDRKGYQFFVYLEQNMTGCQVSIEDVVPDEELLPVVYDYMAKMVKKSDGSPMKQVLRAAACFLYPMLGESAMQPYFQLIDDLYSMDDELHDSGCLSEFFTEKLNEFIKTEKFIDVYPVEYVDKDLHDIDRAIFYTNNYLFISEKMFKVIVDPLIHQIPIDSLKKSLKDDQILVPNQDSATYTVKITINTVVGKKRIRMLRFNRKSLHEEGEPELIDRCLMIKENKEDVLDE